MAQSFPETYRPGPKYGEELERIFGTKKKACGWCNDSGLEEGTSDPCRRGCELSPEIVEDAKALCPELLLKPSNPIPHTLD